METSSAYLSRYIKNNIFKKRVNSFISALVEPYVTGRGGIAHSEKLDDGPV
jgi:hypothetical protein